MKKGLLFVFIILGCMTLVMSCGPQKYIHKDPAFSFDIVSSYTNEKKDHAAEVARYAAPTQYKIPVYAAAVLDKPEGLALADSSEVVIDVLQKAYPAASRFTVLKQNTVKLSDGTDAQAMELKWKWQDGVNTLKSVFVVAFSGNKLIYLSGTDLFASATSMDELMKQCMTLTLK